MSMWNGVAKCVTIPAVFFLTSCEKSNTAPVTEPKSSYVGMKILGDQTIFADEGCGPITPTRTYVFRIRKADIFNGPSEGNGGDCIKKKGIRQIGVKWDETAGTGGEVDPTYEAKSQRGTPFDMNLQLNAGEVVLVKIVLKQNGPFVFRPNDQNNRVRAITAGDSNGDIMMCGAEYRDSKTAVFFVRNDGSVAASTFGSYNIGIDIQQTNGLVLPITIDPNVKNNG